MITTKRFYKIVIPQNWEFWNLPIRWRSTTVESPEEATKRIEAEETPSIHDMTMYNYRKARTMLQPKFETSLELMGNLELEELRRRLRGISRLVESTVIVYKMNFPVKRDSGDYDIITGYRIQHCQHRIPVKGGVRFVANMSEEDLRGLAALSTFRNGTVAAPFGGAIGAVLIDPSKYSDFELERITRQYTLELLKKNIIGPGIDVLGTDIKTGPREMAWLADTYISTFGHGDIHALGVTTGKPRAVGGMQGRFSAIGLGVSTVIQAFLNNKKYMDQIALQPGWTDKTAIIQGFGNVGEHTATHIAMAGAKIIGIMEESSAIYNEKGLDIPKLVEHKKSKKTTKDFPSAKDVASLDSLMYEKCDILVLAAKERVISLSNVDKIQAKIVVEGANAPVTPAAYKRLLERNILVIPDILANSGGVACSFFEWLKNVNHVAFGRLSFGYGRYSMEKVLRSISYSLETGLNKNIKVGMSPVLRKRMYEPLEKHIVESSVSHTMEIAVNEVLKYEKEFQLGTDLRAAAYCHSTFRLFQMLAQGGLSY